MRSVALLVSSSVLLVLGLAGCSRDANTPLAPACREGPNAVIKALAAAPRPVSLDGTSLSGCLREAGRNGDSAELTELGIGYVEAASRLARVAERRPDSRQALQLGYLIGAVHSVSSNRQGTSTELVRRVENEASQVDPGGTTYRRGQRAGRRAG